MIKLSNEEVDILGRPNFMCRDIAQALIDGGIYEQGPEKAEYEQAVCIHWMQGLLAIHGDSWRNEAGKILGELRRAHVVAASSGQ